MLHFPDKYWIFLAIFFIAPRVHGQQKVNYIEIINLEDGLSNNIVSGIIQDNRGFLWAATSYGLNRYDGKEVIQYLHDTGTASLPDNAIYKIIQKDSNHLAIATDRGIATMDLRNFSIRITHLAPQGIQTGHDDQIHQLTKDYLGNIWACTPSVIYRLDSAYHILNVYRTQNEPLKSRKKNVFKVIALPTGEILFWIYNGLYCWSPKRQNLDLLNGNPNNPYHFLYGSSFFSVGLVNSRYLVRIYGSNLRVLDILKQSYRLLPIPDKKRYKLLSFRGTFGNNMVFDSQGNGLFIYSIDTTSHTPRLVRKSAGMFRDLYATQMIQDSEGNYWASSATKGLLKITREKQLFFHRDLIDRESNQPSPYEVSNFYKWGNQIFIGTFRDGYFQYDLASGHIQQYSVDHRPYSEDMVWNFLPIAEDTMWIGTQYGLLWCNIQNHSTGLLNKPHPSIMDTVAITFLFKDSKGRVWIGLGSGNGVAVYDTYTHRFIWRPNQPGEYPYRYPLRAGEDAKGNIWFISDVTGNLVKWDAHAAAFQKVIVPGINGEVHFQSGGFYLDRKKNDIWYGVLSIGLVQYNINSGKVHIYDTRDGLNAGLITGIQMDKTGLIWLSTTQGISCFDPETGSCNNFLKSDGLPALYYSSSLMLDTIHNNMYAGAPGKLTWWHLPLNRTKKPPLKIYLTGLLINNQKRILPLDKRLILAPDQNNLILKFSGINLSNGMYNRYQYRLNKGDWTDIGHSNEIRFASLSPGSYSLALKGARKDEAYGPELSLILFTISPPFTATIWFYLICFGAALGLLYFWYRYRLSNLKKMEAIRAGISRDLHDEIGSRLTNINMLSQIARQKINEPQENEMVLIEIQKESEGISQNMREIIWNVDPENDELEEALPHMLHYASQLLESGGIAVEADMPELSGIKIDMEKRRDLYLIFKEAVHNILKHSGASRAEILISHENNMLHLHIQDNGKGMDLTQLGSRSGLRYMQQRANKHHWTLRTDSSRGKGTIVQLAMKLKN